MWMWLDRLFHRGGSYDNVDDLSGRSRERLVARARALSREERQVQDLLGLPYPPRLSLVDEETVAIVTASERGRLQTETDG